MIPKFITTETYTDHLNTTDIAQPEEFVSKGRSDIVTLRVNTRKCIYASQL